MKLVIAFLLLVGLTTSAWANAPKGQIIKTTGTIRHQGIEGGFWGILGDDGKNYDPTNLAQEFQKEGLRVAFEAVRSSSQASTHMWGTIVDIKSVKKAGTQSPGQVPDSLKPVTGIAKADLATTWKAADRVMAARGEALVVRDETTETIATKPHDLERDALLASIKSRTKPEDSGYRKGTYELSINLTEQGKKKTRVEVKAKIMAFGTESKAMAKPDTWDPVASNGKIEKEVLKAILAEAKKKK
jgi:hypothetical protein